MLSIITKIRISPVNKEQEPIQQGQINTLQSNSYKPDQD